MKVNPLIHANEGDLRHRRGDRESRPYPTGENIGTSRSSHSSARACGRPARPSFPDRLDMGGKNVGAAPREDLAPPNQFHRKREMLARGFVFFPARYYGRGELENALLLRQPI